MRQGRGNTSEKCERVYQEWKAGDPNRRGICGRRDVCDDAGDAAEQERQLNEDTARIGESCGQPKGLKLILNNFQQIKLNY